MSDGMSPGGELTLEDVHTLWKTWSISAAITETGMTILPHAEMVGVEVAEESE